MTNKPSALKRWSPHTAHRTPLPSIWETFRKNCRHAGCDLQKNTRSVQNKQRPRPHQLTEFQTSYRLFQTDSTPSKVPICVVCTTAHFNQHTSIASLTQQTARCNKFGRLLNAEFVSRRHESAVDLFHTSTPQRAWTNKKMQRRHILLEQEQQLGECRTL